MRGRKEGGMKEGKGEVQGKGVLRKYTQGKGKEGKEREGVRM